MCTVPNTDSSMSPRTEDGIALLPTGNRTGSVRVYSIATGKVVTRDQIRILPMPMSVVAHMNDLATKEGRTLVRTHGAPSMPSVYDTPHMSRTTRHPPLPDFFTPTVRAGPDPDIVIRDPAPAPLFDTHPADDSVILPSYTHVRETQSTHASLRLQRAPTFVFNFKTHHGQTENQNRNRPGMATPRTPPKTKLTARMGATERVGVTERAGVTERVGVTESVGVTERVGVTSTAGVHHRQSMMDYFRNGGATVLVQLVTRVRARHAALVRDRAKYKIASTIYEAERKRAANSSCSHVMNITVREALRTRGHEAERVIMKELKQMLDKKV
jgi:hypothetical protein